MKHQPPPPRCLDLPTLWAHFEVDRDQPELRSLAGNVDWNGVVLEPLRTGGAAALLRSKNGKGAVALAKRAPNGGPTGANGWLVMTVETDPYLPGAVLLGDRARLAEVLAVDRIAQVVPVSYHPGRRAVIRVVGLRGHRAVPYYLKLFRESAYHRAVRVYHALGNASGPVRFVMPCATLDRFASLLTDEARAESMHERLRRGAGIDIVSLASGIRSLHETYRLLGLPFHSLEDEQRATLKMLMRGSLLLPELEDLIVRVSALVLPSTPNIGLLHRDLHDKQILWSQRGLFLLDAEGAALGPRLIDAINLAEHFHLRSMQVPNAPRELEARFLASYGVDAADPAVGTVRALICGRLAGVYACRPRWWAIARKFAARCLSVLETQS